MLYASTYLKLILILINILVGVGFIGLGARVSKELLRFSTSQNRLVQFVATQRGVPVAAGYVVGSGIIGVSVYDLFTASVQLAHFLALFLMGLGLNLIGYGMLYIAAPRHDQHQKTNQLWQKITPLILISTGVLSLLLGAGIGTGYLSIPKIDSVALLCMFIGLMLSLSGVGGLRGHGVDVGSPSQPELYTGMNARLGGLLYLVAGVGYLLLGCGLLTMLIPYDSQAFSYAFALTSLILLTRVLMDIARQSEKV